MQAMYQHFEQQRTPRTIPLAELNYLAAARAAQEVLSRVSGAASPTAPHPLGQSDHDSIGIEEGNTEPAPPSSPPPEGGVSAYLDYGQLQVPLTYLDWHKARLPNNWTSLEPHQLPFLPSPAATDLHFMGFHHQSSKALASISHCGPFQAASVAADAISPSWLDPSEPPVRLTVPTHAWDALLRLLAPALALQALTSTRPLEHQQSLRTGFLQASRNPLQPTAAGWILSALSFPQRPRHLLPQA